MRDFVQRRKQISLLLLSMLLLSWIVGQTPLQVAQAQQPSPVSAVHPLAPQATNWCVAGSFQGWDNASTPLFDDGTNGDVFANDGIYSRAVPVATAGIAEFKAVECGNWGLAYPVENAWLLTTSANQVVTITFDTNAHASDGYAPSQFIVNAWDAAAQGSFTVAGSFQGWDNANPATLMSAAGYGLFRLDFTVAAAGTYDFKIVETGTWDRQVTAAGRTVNPGGAVLQFTTTAPNQQVAFVWDSRTGRVKAAPAAAGTGNWCAAGEFQGWDNASTPLYDDGTNGDLLANDGIYSRDVTVAAAGTGGFKAVACGDWGTAYPPKNAWIYTTAAAEVVKLTFDTNAYADGRLPAQNIVNAWDSASSFTAAGSFQGWDNANPATVLNEVAPGLFVLRYPVATPGSYQAKLTQTGSWSGQIVAQGRAIDTENPDPLSFDTTNLNETVVFWFDQRSGRLAIVPQGDGQLPVSNVGDGLVNRAALEHNSQEALYRTPFGAAPTGQAVTLRFRTARNDVERVRVRLYWSAAAVQQVATLTQVGSDAQYAYWAYTLPAQTELGVVYYRFIIEDGATTLYYEDDSLYDGGLGEALTASLDRSWNIYIYDAAFATPEWAQDAVIYQIFVERFRNGNVANDPTDNPATDQGWFYPTERGHRFPVAPWNTIVPDPEPFSDLDNPWHLTYSSTMYGGDLQGVTEKLDYLQSLGVTTVYLNPIFDSPSNHKYDGRSYRDVDPAFGGKSAFDALVAGLDARGMYLVLDAVPNHVSSDSPYFDRFARHTTVGACESASSPYRSWFFFDDVAEGSGSCADSQNRPNSATYRGWFGVETLPQINTANPEVLSYWFSDVGTSNPNVPYTNTVNYWLDEGADGWRVDVVPDVVGVNPTFFEDWRRNIKTEHPDAVTYSETWSEGDVRDRVLGDEFDSTMNYRFRKTVLGFGRDTRWTDNDGGQEVDPLTPSEFVKAFKAIEEDYPRPAFLAAMNLLDSHDTNRLVHVLNEPGFTGDREPVDDFAEARERQKLVAALQMTLPGAPTIYYGDEVGLTGFGSDVDRDDPYNRQPYPWADAAGYGSLPAWRQAQADTLAHYQTLTSVRNAHSFLRTGSFDPLYTDDAAGVLVFGRKDATGAGIVVLNQSTMTQTVSVDLAQYVPAVNLDQAAPGSGTLAPSGTTYTFTVGPRGYGIWVTPNGTNLDPPAAPTITNATASETTSLIEWNPVAGATGYTIYRSSVSGGGYALVGTYTDGNVTNFSETLTPGFRYYYVVRTVVDGVESANSNEVLVLPAYLIDLAMLASPDPITHTISAITPTLPITAWVYIETQTEPAGPAPMLRAEVGYGPDGSDPATAAWMWSEASYNGEFNGNMDEFVGTLLPSSVGVFDVAYRFSTSDGASWTYVDTSWDDGIYDPAEAVTLTVLSSGDTTAPDAPTNLHEVSRAAARIEIAWDAPAATDVAFYEVWRDGALLATVPVSSTSYVDTEVTTNVTYAYSVRAVDLSFNMSPFVGPLEVTAELRNVNVTFRVRVPDETPPGSTVYIAGDNAAAFGAQWNPGQQPLTEVSPHVWEFTTVVPEGTTLQYKYVRGAWERVEWWGTLISVANRSVTVQLGDNGAFLVDNTAIDWGTGADETKAVQRWRDPLVASVSPPDGSLDLPATQVVSATWSTPVTVTGALTTSLVVRLGQTVIPGTVELDGATVVWTPLSPLADGEYTATAFNVERADIGEPVPMHQPYVWSFQVGTPVTEYRLFMPLVRK